MRKKYSQIHLFLETDLKEALERESRDESISISELCRKKLRQSSQLTRIEILLEKILEKRADFSTPKAGKSALRK